MLALQVCFVSNIILILKYLYQTIKLHAAKQEAHADNMNNSELEFKIFTGNNVC